MDPARRCDLRMVSSTPPASLGFVFIEGNNPIFLAWCWSKVQVFPIRLQHGYQPQWPWLRKQRILQSIVRDSRGLCSPTPSSAVADPCRKLTSQSLCSLVVPCQQVPPSQDNLPCWHPQQRGQKRNVVWTLTNPLSPQGGPQVEMSPGGRAMRGMFPLQQLVLVFLR